MLLADLVPEIAKLGDALPPPATTDEGKLRTCAAILTSGLEGV